MVILQPGKLELHYLHSKSVSTPQKKNRKSRRDEGEYYPQLTCEIQYVTPWKFFVLLV